MIRFPNATARAIYQVIANWHYAGILQQLREAA